MAAAANSPPTALAPGPAYAQGWATQRLRAVPATAELAPAWADYYRRNGGGHTDHLFAWEPTLPPRPVPWFERTLKMWGSASRCDLGYVYALQRPGEPTTMVGLVQLSQVVRGGYQCAHLGFSIDREHQGHGLMREALEAGIHAFFSEPAPLAFHRLQTLVHPDNRRSLNLLSGLGFELEGIARQAVFLRGQWQDHFMLSRVNQFRQTASVACDGLAAWPDASAG